MMQVMEPALAIAGDLSLYKEIIEYDEVQRFKLSGEDDEVQSKGSSKIKPNDKDYWVVDNEDNDDDDDGELKRCQTKVSDGYQSDRNFFDECQTERGYVLCSLSAGTVYEDKRDNYSDLNGEDRSENYGDPGGTGDHNDYWGKEVEDEDDVDIPDPLTAYNLQMNEFLDKICHCVLLSAQSAIEHDGKTDSNVDGRYQGDDNFEMKSEDTEDKCGDKNDDDGKDDGRDGNENKSDNNEVDAEDDSKLDLQTFNRYMTMVSNKHAVVKTVDGWIRYVSVGKLFLVRLIWKPFAKCSATSTCQRETSSGCDGTKKKGTSTSGSTNVCRPTLSCIPRETSLEPTQMSLRQHRNKNIQ